jgi:outer membrane protein assembly factor BamC
METNFLENHPEIPDQSVGLIRSMLKKATKARYALPIIILILVFSHKKVHFYY